MTKIKSPLKHLGTGEGHGLMTKESHINAHGGDAIAAGFGEEESEVETSAGDMPAPFPSAVVIFK